MLLEHNHAFKGLSWHQALFDSLFQSATTRSAGLQTIDVSHFSDATNIIMSILMFIGSSLQVRLVEVSVQLLLLFLFFLLLILILLLIKQVSKPLIEKFILWIFNVPLRYLQWHQF